MPNEGIQKKRGAVLTYDTGNGRFDCAVKSGGLPVDTGEIGLALHAVGRKSATQAVAGTLHRIRWDIGAFCQG